MQAFNLRILGVDIHVKCLDPRSAEIISKGFSELIVPATTDSSAALSYTLGKSEEHSGFMLSLKGEMKLYYESDYEFLYFFEKSVTMELQKIRNDLFVIHSAALEYKGNACLLVAESGGGKSTTAWALLHNGFNYLSDELASIDVKTMNVYPYPHALCLKKEPPEPFGFPQGTLYTSRTKHIPTEHIPAKVIDCGTRLVAIFFVKFDPDASAPDIKSVSSAEAGARVYANTLNLLAHSRYGLDAAIEIGSKCHCFDLKTADLQATCELIKTEMEMLQDNSLL